jgi:magnesium transporter
VLTINIIRRSEGEGWKCEKIAALPRSVGTDEVLWVNLKDPVDAEIALLQEGLAIDLSSLKDLAKADQNAKIEEFENHFFAYLTYPKREGMDVFHLKMEKLGLFLGSWWLITSHEGDSEVTCNFERRISLKGYAALSPIPTPDILFYLVLDLVLDSYHPFFDFSETKYEELRKEAAQGFRVAKSQSETRSIGLALGGLRDQLHSVKQSIVSIREMIERFTRGEFPQISTKNLPRFMDAYDRAVELRDMVDSNRDYAAEVRDLLINALTVTTNNVIRVLTIISAIFLPLALIAEVYGTNFAHGFFQPGSGTPYGFYGMIVAMAIIAMSLVALFRAKGWL